MKIKNAIITIILSFIMGSCFASIKHHPTIILVHGALLTSSSWAPVQSYLQNSGYNVVTIDMPGRVNDGIQPNDATLKLAVEKVCKVATLQHAPVMLVGHSQAGAIITEATKYCGASIKALVYITAVIPLSGEKPFDLFSQQDNHNFDIVAPIDNNSGLAIPDRNAPIKKLFMDDANDADATRAINDMEPEPVILADAELNYDPVIFNSIPKFYIKTSKDMIISPETQDKYIKRQNMKGIFILDTGHSPFISQPQTLGKKLAEINDTLSN